MSDATPDPEPGDPEPGDPELEALKSKIYIPDNFARIPVSEVIVAEWHVASLLDPPSELHIVINIDNDHQLALTIATEQAFIEFVNALIEHGRTVFNNYFLYRS